MLRKEFNEITISSLRKLIYVLAIVTCLKIIFPGIGYLKMLIESIGVYIFWVAIDYSVGMYKYETNDHSWEYLLSLPIPRRRILFFKILPRIMNICVLLVLYVFGLKMFFDDISVKNQDFLHPYLIIPCSIGCVLSGMVFRMSDFRGKYQFLLLDYAFLGVTVWFLNLYWKSFFIKTYDEYLYIGTLMIGFLLVSMLNSILFIKHFNFFDKKQSSINGRSFTLFARPYLLAMIFLNLLMIFFRINSFL